MQVDLPAPMPADLDCAAPALVPEIEAMDLS